MSEPLLEFFGTWEEIAKHEPELRGHKVKLTVLDGISLEQTNNQKSNLPRGSYARIMQGLSRFPLEPGEQKVDLWEVIAEERSVWRKMAREKQDEIE